MITHKEDIVEKWKHVLEVPITPLSACKVILIEPFTTWEQEYLCEFVYDNKQRKI